MNIKSCVDCHTEFEVHGPRHILCGRCSKARRAVYLHKWYLRTQPQRKHRYALRSVEERRKWYRDYAKKHPERIRNSALKVRYGIGLKEFYALLAQQGNTCGLCDCPLPKPGAKRPCVDHDHVTRRIRGVLCMQCNLKLGWFEKRRARILAYLDG